MTVVLLIADGKHRADCGFQKVQRACCWRSGRIGQLQYIDDISMTSMKHQNVSGDKSCAQNRDQYSIVKQQPYRSVLFLNKYPRHCANYDQQLRSIQLTELGAGVAPLTA